MASRALFNNQLIQTVKRSGVRFSSTATAVEQEAIKSHAAKSADTWKKISIFVCIPALAAASLNAYNLYEKHHEHQLHHPKEWVKYEYINLRVRPFFWGKESLFFNPKVNLSADA
ncbi:cytochrome c oxidase, subunit VIa [Cunninghamella echinulata]|nr:cytochrome c oxidase, subunit VIa [Cunninghamella echinulata]